MKKDKKTKKNHLSPKKKIILRSVLAVLLLALIGWTIRDNTTVGLTTITVTEENLPRGFDGFRIAHVSDLHNSRLWEKTIQQLKEADPDMIVITGDLVDARRTDVDVAMQFIREAVRIADCFYVPGNHEASLPEETYQQLTAQMRDYGVVIMDDSEIVVHRDGSQISIVGHGWNEETDLSQIGSFDGYRILLSHWPEYFSDYATAGFDLVFSGHTHGGQVRLPLIGAIYGPNQGLFPKYDAGLFSEGKTDMIVNRGIGNSRFPFRFFNQPEVILVELQRG